MKLLPMKFRETQAEWFAKRGLSWHFSAVIHRSGHRDCQVEGNGEHAVHTYVAVLDNCKQDWFSVSNIIEEVLVTVKQTHPTVSSAVVGRDKAGCYHSPSLLASIHSTLGSLWPQNCSQREQNTKLNKMFLGWKTVGEWSHEVIRTKQKKAPTTSKSCKWSHKYIFLFGASVHCNL